MKMFQAWVVLFASLASAGGILASAQAPAQTTANDNRRSRNPARLNTLVADAFLHQDAKAMQRLWSNDFVVTNPLNKFVNKPQALGMMESGFLVTTSYNRQIEYLRRHGDTAIAAGSETVVWGGRMPSPGKTEHLRVIGIWMKQDGRWQEVARHANLVPHP